MNITKLILTSIITIVFTACGGGSGGSNANGSSSNGSTTDGNSSTDGSSTSELANNNQVRVKKHTFTRKGMVERICEYEYYNDTYRFLKKQRCRNNPYHPLYPNHTIYETISTYKYDSKGFLKESQSIQHKYTNPKDKEKTFESNSTYTYEDKTSIVETIYNYYDQNRKTKTVTKNTYDKNYENLIKSISTTYDQSDKEIRKNISEHNSTQNGNKFVSHSDTKSYENKKFNSRGLMDWYFTKTKSGDLIQEKISIKSTLSDNSVHEYITTYKYDDRYDKFIPNIPTGLSLGNQKSKQAIPRMVAYKSYERVFIENGKKMHTVVAEYTNTYHRNNFIKRSEYVYSKYHTDGTVLKSVEIDEYEYY